MPARRTARYDRRAGAERSVRVKPLDAASFYCLIFNGPSHGLLSLSETWKQVRREVCLRPEKKYTLEYRIDHIVMKID